MLPSGCPFFVFRVCAAMTHNRPGILSRQAAVRRVPERGQYRRTTAVTLPKISA